MPAAMRDKVFISYSHKDKDWLERLQIMLKPLLRKGSVVLWNDTEIRAGLKWKEQIRNALASARIAVLLVSPNFLASDFIAENELPPLMAAAEKGGLTILWVCLSACLYEESKIAEYQAAHEIALPLDNLTESQQNAALRTICQRIKEAFNKPSVLLPPMDEMRILVAEDDRSYIYRLEQVLGCHCLFEDNLNDALRRIETEEYLHAGIFDRYLPSSRGYSPKFDRGSMEPNAGFILADGFLKKFPYGRTVITSAAPLDMFEAEGQYLKIVDGIHCWFIRKGDTDIQGIADILREGFERICRKAHD
jgi:hypothetical protein